MTTTNQINTPPTKAEPTYSAVLYDFAPVGWTNKAEEQSALVQFNVPSYDTTGLKPIPTKPVKPGKRGTKKSKSESLKLKEKRFEGALLDIYRYGLECNLATAKIEATIAEPITNAAILGLAKILGTYRTYFDEADEAEKTNFSEILVRKCRTDFGKSAVVKFDKRTTEWHLLSRMFRQSDRRQASADAKILRFAHTEGVTEDAFAAWVKKYGTLSNILKGIPAEKAVDEHKKVTKEKPLLRWVTAAQVPDTNPQEALDALKRLADGKSYNIVIHHHHGRFDIMRREASDAPSLPNDDAKEEQNAFPPASSISS